MTAYDDLVEMISTPTDDCIVWPHSKFDDGYGQVRVGSKMRRAHRVALQLSKPAPVGKVCSVKGKWVPGHKLVAAHGPCHNPVCFNPQHLSWSTSAENEADKKRDGTDVYVSNEAHGSCKLSNADVVRIRELYKGRGKGPSQYELADQFGCGQGHISDIVLGRTRTLPVNAQSKEDLQQV